MRQFTWLIIFLFTTGCASIPEGIEPVSGFEVNRYLGKWYEIARLDHRFERGLSNISAEYSQREDGDIRVINRGYSDEKQVWKQAEGRAKFTAGPDIGRLKVAFFGPFYGGYNIIALDKQNYQYVMIAGNSRDYLWILSRTPSLDRATYESLLAQADSLGFPVRDLIVVDHSRNRSGE